MMSHIDNTFITVERTDHEPQTDLRVPVWDGEPPRLPGEAFRRPEGPVLFRDSLRAPHLRRLQPTRRSESLAFRRGRLNWGAPRRSRTLRQRWSYWYSLRPPHT